MSHPMEPVTFDQRTPRARGRAHGELWRAEIAELLEIRRDLTLSLGRCRTMDEVEAVAHRHVAVLTDHDAELSEELLGIAEGAALRPLDLVIVNHYTDLRDVPPSVLDPEPDGCTAIYFGTPEGPVLGQTWDMHASAERFVRTIRIQPPDTDDEYLCFTLTGCLGMAGIGSRGVAVTINNLSTTDGGLGVVWPAVVRRMLAQPHAAAARSTLERSPLSGGHHYMIADGHDFFGIECSGTLKVLTQTGARAAHLHTNHCFDPKLRQCEAVPRRSTTFHRLNMATTLFSQFRPSSAGELWDLLGSHDGEPRSICSHAHGIDDDPHGSKTCGRLVMDVTKGRMKVARGCSRDDAGIEVALERFCSGAASV